MPTAKTPRRTSLTELAAGLGIANSADSGTLDRAEPAIIRAYLDAVAEPTRTVGLATPDGIAPLKQPLPKWAPWSDPRLASWSRPIGS